MADEDAWEEGSHARVIQEAARHNRTDVIQAAVAHYKKSDEASALSVGDMLSRGVGPETDGGAAPLHVAAALGDLAAVESMVGQGGDAGEAEPLLGRGALHLATVSGHVDVVRLLIEQPTVDAGAHDAAGRTPLDHAQSMLERHRGNAELEARLNAVIDTLMQADLLKQIERQATEGVTCAEGQRVRNYFQSQIGGNVSGWWFSVVRVTQHNAPTLSPIHTIHTQVDEYWPEVIISYATGTRMTWSGHSHDLLSLIHI